MKIAGRKVLVCNCEVSMPLDGRGLARALAPGEELEVHTQLCRAQVDRLRQEVAGGEPLLVACTQEAPLFDEVRAEFGPETDLRTANIRERAGWSEEGGSALPKIAALLAEAVVDVPPTPTLTLESKGECLVYGRGQTALDVARQLQGRLAVTLLLEGDDDEVIPPRVMDVPVYGGRIAALNGHLGAFEIRIDRHAPVRPSARDRVVFERAQDGVSARADLILDLSGGAPLVTAPEKRDGYFRPDPRDPAAVQRALFELTDLVGEFEKPRYVDFDAAICAYSRSGRTGCTRCLEVCPAGAIEPAGDAVRVDPYICGGCGACHSVCPTGAASYAFPPATSLLLRLQTLLRTYRTSGGERPVLLVHDDRHGAEMISLISRFAGGLPASVIPFAVNEVTEIGLDGLLGALAFGATRVLFLVPPARRDETAGLEAGIGVAERVLEGLGYGGGRIELVDDADPDAVAARLRTANGGPAMPAATYRPAAGKRTLMRLALDALHDAAPAPVEVVPLPERAPFGRAIVDTDGCTLCLACVGVCPTGAFQDDPDHPRLSFQEEACVQCGLCVATCPERVISLEPRLNFSPDAKRAVLVKEEEPATCIRCGKPFGTRSSVEKVVQVLSAKHWMFNDPSAVDRIRMCEDCRVVVQFEAKDNPLAGAPRQRPRTTDDYLREREEIAAARRRLEDERGDG